MCTPIYAPPPPSLPTPQLCYGVCKSVLFVSVHVCQHCLLFASIVISSFSLLHCFCFANFGTFFLVLIRFSSCILNTFYLGPFWYFFLVLIRFFSCVLNSSYLGSFWYFFLVLIRFFSCILNTLYQSFEVYTHLCLISFFIMLVWCHFFTVSFYSALINGKGKLI